ncbi:MAG: hypothetical protein KJ583_07465 [Nanoarchaeota archaeon]|nr:hypothetical protein [Nanoarchaeota archaeon]MBU1269692.1 hypothetical protein [Nanoarchaeota archaeon]MBU1605126.1 hypothetical protein [Nanoarchaeota archaeon]MBU2442921.1 hypothetical protein [Nanoarchaeota archaeon]
MKSEQFLADMPIITKADIKKMLSCNDDYAYTVLNRLLNRNRIRKVVKGKYTSIDDIYVISSNLHVPSYISFWSASYLKGYTEQITRTVHVASTGNYPAVEFENYRIEFHKIRKDIFFGYEKKRFGKHYAFIADDEKLLIDSLLFQRNAGNPDEIIKIIKAAAINEEKMIMYLKRIDNVSLNKRAGFLLERYKGMDISGKVNAKDRNYVCLSLFDRSKKTDAKWRVKHDLP